MTQRSDRGPGNDGVFMLVHLMSVLLVSGLVLAAAVMLQWQRYESVLESAAPRIARLSGMLEARDAIAAALEESRAAAGRYAYPASVDAARAASDFQTRVREVFQSSGMNVAGSQQFPIRPGESYDEISMSVSVVGTLPQLDAVLTRLQQLAPVAMVEQLRIQPVFVATATDQKLSQTLSIQARFVTIRMRGA